MLDFSKMKFEEWERARNRTKKLGPHCKWKYRSHFTLLNAAKSCIVALWKEQTCLSLPTMPGLVMWLAAARRMELRTWAERPSMCWSSLAWLLGLLRSAVRTHSSIFKRTNGTPEPSPQHLVTVGEKQTPNPEAVSQASYAVMDD